jgi:uncharacterized membrane protein
MLVKKSSDSHNAFERLHAIHKIIICIVLATAAYFIADIKGSALIRVMIGWNTFSLCMIIMEWITFKITTPDEIRKQAQVQDASRAAIFIIVLISAFASFFAVLLLVISGKEETQAFDIPVAVAGMFFSWFLVHTIFAMRYAHIYYGDHETNPDMHAGGLVFPDDDKPGYSDFAYFSFVLGMTFQVSDIQIISKRLRRIALLHGILSFGFNTIIVALTINVIAGLTK